MPISAEGQAIISAICDDIGSGDISSQMAPLKNIAKLVMASVFGAVPEVRD